MGMLFFVCLFLCFLALVCVFFLFKTEKEHEVGFEEYLGELVEGEMKKKAVKEHN